MSGKQNQQLVEIGDRLRLSREALALTQRRVCERIGVLQQTWNQWERGKRRQDPIAMIRYANAYSVSLDWIYRADLSGVRHDLAARIIDLQQAEMSLAGAKRSRQ